MIDKFSQLEQSFKNYKNVKKDKKDSLMKERENYLQAQRTLMVIMLAIAQDYRDLYPGASGSVIARIKSFNSLSTKIDNEFASIQALQGATQQDILKKIREIDLKDIFATSVITEGLPQKFATGNDDLDKVFTELLNSVLTSENRIEEHKKFSQSNINVLLEKESEKQRLLEELEKARSKEEIEKQLSKLNTKLEDLIKQGNLSISEFREIDNQRDVLKSEKSKEELQSLIEVIEKEIQLYQNNSEYGEVNLSRTEKVYAEELSDLQYEMSSYYAQNANEKSNLSFLNTQSIRKPKQIKKSNGFRAVNTGYAIESDGEKLVTFEIQGKGYLDYEKAEFGDGAEYHENQKTEEGQRSKRNDMPDFTIIGEKETDKIEREVILEYSKIDLLDMFNSDKEKADFLNKINEYKQKLLKAESLETKEKLEDLYGVTYLSPEVIEDLINKQYEAQRNIFIQKEIDRRIFLATVQKADSEEYEKKIEQTPKLKQDYEDIKLKLLKRYKMKAKDFDQRYILEAKTILLFKQKSDEILEFAEQNVPIFFEATISKDANESPIVYRLTPGECIYRNYYNRLNGLKLSDGTVIYEPKVQQKNALFKLVDLFQSKDSYMLDLSLEDKSDESR